MTFQNPVVAGEQLVRNAIKSPNYQPGGDGWRIAQDGSAEFGDVIIRGTVSGSVAHADTADSATNATNSTNAYNAQSTVFNDTQGWSITADGNATFHNVTTSGYATGPVGAYDDLSANTTFTYQGTELTDLLSAYPLGIVARGTIFGSDGPYVSAVGVEKMLMQLTFTPDPTRRYKVHVNPHYISSDTANARVDYIVRPKLVSSGDVVNTDTPVYVMGQMLMSPVINSNVTADMTKEISFPFSAPLNVGLSFKSIVGNATISSSDVEVTIEDIGLNLNSVAKNLYVATTSKTLHTFSGYLSQSASYDDNGYCPTPTNALMYQGYYPGNGQWESFCWHTGSLSTSLTAMSGALAADVVYLDVYLYYDFWYYMSGGNSLMGYHTNPTVGDPNAQGYGSVQNLVNTQFTARGQGKWISVKGTAIQTAILNGTFKGIVLGNIAGGTDEKYYGHAIGTANTNGHGPQIRAQYYK